ncbi:MAG: hypothetical protein P4M12_03945 [Gammaproteobacteria bacterium]|nr:hypothetical protein [Gammaproteobacteria bacterium]
MPTKVTISYNIEGISKLPYSFYINEDRKTYIHRESLSPRNELAKTDNGILIRIAHELAQLKLNETVKIYQCHQYDNHGAVHFQALYEYQNQFRILDRALIAFHPDENSKIEFASCSLNNDIHFKPINTGPIDFPHTQNLPEINNISSSLSAVTLLFTPKHAAHDESDFDFFENQNHIIKKINDQINFTKLQMTQLSEYESELDQLINLYSQKQEAQIHVETQQAWIKLRDDVLTLKQNIAPYKTNLTACLELLNNQVESISIIAEEYKKETSLLSHMVEPIKVKLINALQYSVLQYLEYKLNHYANKLGDKEMARFNEMLSSIAKLTKTSNEYLLHFNDLSTLEWDKIPEEVHSLLEKGKAHSGYIHYNHFLSFITQNIRACLPETAANSPINITVYKEKLLTSFEWKKDLLPKISEVKAEDYKIYFTSENEKLEKVIHDTSFKKAEFSLHAAKLDGLKIAATTNDTNEKKVTKRIAKNLKEYDIQIAEMLNQLKSHKNDFTAMHNSIALVKKQHVEWNINPSSMTLDSKLQNANNRYESIMKKFGEEIELLSNQKSGVNTWDLFENFKTRLTAVKENLFLSNQREIHTQLLEVSNEFSHFKDAGKAEKLLADEKKIADEQALAMKKLADEQAAAAKSAETKKQRENNFIITLNSIIKTLRNSDAWAKQVSFFGGTSITTDANVTIKVPQGIAEMYLLTSNRTIETYEEANTLCKKFKEITKKAEGRGGSRCCFNVRKNTTSDLYDLINNFNPISTYDFTSLNQQLGNINYKLDPSQLQSHTVQNHSLFAKNKMSPASQTKTLVAEEVSYSR